VKRLTLMRHGNAQWKDPQMADFDRPLNRRGNSEAEAMSRRLAELNLVPSILLTSSARRAQQTAAIVARELRVAPRRIRSEEALYLAGSEDIMRLIHSMGPRIPHVMIIGHNPGITEVANLFGSVPRMQDLATAAVCSLTFDTQNWAAVGAETLRETQSESPPLGLFALWA
jgi:phosphohistidine phosphatase